MEERGGGRSRVYVSPDGLTRFSTVAKVQRWHRQQLALASRFQSQAAQQQQQQQQPVAREARAAARVVGEGDGESADDGGGGGGGGGSGAKKPLPRELRNLVLPDREWNVPGGGGGGGGGSGDGGGGAQGHRPQGPQPEGAKPEAVGAPAAESRPPSGSGARNLLCSKGWRRSFG